MAGSINGDVWFSCLGTILKAAGSKEKQWQIDYTIPAKFAAIARKNGVPATVLLSAYGASVKSNVFYSRMKGKLEEYIDSLGFHHYIIFRPGLWLRKDTDRIGERISAGIIKALNRLGLIRRFRPMPTSILAERLGKAVKIFSAGRHIVELEKIFKL